MHTGVRVIIVRVEEQGKDLGRARHLQSVQDSRRVGKDPRRGHAVRRPQRDGHLAVALVVVEHVVVLVVLVTRRRAGPASAPRPEPQHLLPQAVGLQRRFQGPSPRPAGARVGEEERRGFAQLIRIEAKAEENGRRTKWAGRGTGTQCGERCT